MGTEQRRVLEAEKGLIFLNQLIFFLSLSGVGRGYSVYPLPPGARVVQQSTCVLYIL